MACCLESPVMCRIKKYPHQMMRVFFYATRRWRIKIASHPGTLTNYADEDHPVRTMDAFVDTRGSLFIGKSLPFVMVPVVTKKNGDPYEEGAAVFETLVTVILLAFLVYAFLRLAIPTRPSRPEPNNQAAAGTGTTPTQSLCEPSPVDANFAAPRNGPFGSTGSGVDR